MEKLFNFAFAEHQKKWKSFLAFMLQSLFRVMMFNLDFRISFFSGIGAFARQGTLIDFLEAQRRTAEILKSWKQNFYRYLLKKARVMKLYKAMKPFFPAAEVSIFSAGEQANNIKKASKVAVSYIIMSKELKDKIKLFVVSVGLYLALFLIFIVFFSTMISDAIEGLVDQMQGGIPESTQMFIDIHAFIQNYLLYLVIGLIILLMVFTYRLPRGKGPFRSKLHKYVPGFRLYRRYVSCSFLLSLAAMLGSGMSFKEALTVIGDTSKGYLKHHTDAMLRKLNGGASASKAIEVGLMPKEMYLNVSQFIGGSEIDKALYDVSEFEMERLVRNVAKYQKLVMMLVFGLGGYLAVKGYSAAVEPALALMKESY